jgi:hypothetical protein
LNLVVVCIFVEALVFALFGYQRTPLALTQRARRFWDDDLAKTSSSAFALLN